MTIPHIILVWLSLNAILFIWKTGLWRLDLFDRSSKGGQESGAQNNQS